MKMTNKGIITSAQETVVAAGKSAAEGAKAIAGEVANVAATAAATAKAATTAAAGAVLDRVATTEWRRAHDFNQSLIATIVVRL
jgi:hypothetical protein